MGAVVGPVQIPASLDTHLYAKVANHNWLRKCQQGSVEAFPYRPDSKGKAVVKNGIISPTAAPTPFTPSTTGKPLFLVNIPVGVTPKPIHDPDKITDIVRQIKEESFGPTPTSSSRTVGGRVAVVVGVNQIDSLDSTRNRNFAQFIKGVPVIDGIAAKVFGFLWKPVWERRPSNPGTYSAKKCFLLLKVLAPKQAEKVRKKYEQPDGLHPNILEQIPYQRIRERVKNAAATRDYLQQMERGAPRSAIYFTTMDADTKALRVRRGGLGVFSRMEELIDEHNYPSIVSVGYQLADSEAPLLRLAVKMDMAVRSTMPMPYFPEPCTVYKVRQPGNPPFLHRLTFVGNGNKLESRRFIQSGSELFNDGAVLAGEGIVTTTPERMKTQTNQASTLTLAHLKQKKSLQALRGRTIQTHAFSKQWADISYAGMNFHVGQVTDATGPMMHIFSVFDPISRMFAADRYTSARFDDVLEEYGRQLRAGEKSTLAAARLALSRLGMKKAQIDSVEETARRSGEAIHRVLQEAVEELS